jgi:chromosome segregation ATPase
MKYWRAFAIFVSWHFATPLYAQTALTGNEQAQTRDAQASLFEGSIKGSLSMLKSLDLVGAEAAVEQDQIRQDTAMFEKGKPIFDRTVAEAKAARQKLEGDIASYQAGLVPHNALIDSHNARCGRVFSKEENAAFQQCNQEQAALQPSVDQAKKDERELAARIAAQESEEARLNKQAQELDAIRAKLIERVAANEKKGLEYRAKRERLIAQIEEFRTRLLALQGSFDSCRSLAGGQQVPAETLHDVCGKAFDGNRVPDSYLPDFSRTPVWSPWGD